MPLIKDCGQFTQFKLGKHCCCQEFKTMIQNSIGITLIGQASLLAEHGTMLQISPMLKLHYIAICLHCKISLTASMQEYNQTALAKLKFINTMLQLLNGLEFGWKTAQLLLVVAFGTIPKDALDLALKYLMHNDLIWHQLQKHVRFSRHSIKRSLQLI